MVSIANEGALCNECLAQVCTGRHSGVGLGVGLCLRVSLKDQHVPEKTKAATLTSPLQNQRASEKTEVATTVDCLFPAFPVMPPNLLTA